MHVHNLGERGKKDFDRGQGFGVNLAAELGMLAGFDLGLLMMLDYGCEDLFQKLPMHWMWWPAIGAVLLGVGGLLEPRVLRVGYDLRLAQRWSARGGTEAECSGSVFKPEF